MQILSFIVDLVLGYIPQAMGCAIMLLVVAGEPVKSKRFLIISCTYTGIAVCVRFLYQAGLVNFGFHTLIIWMLYIVLAVMLFKLPAMKALLSVLPSGFAIALAEIITIPVFIVILGSERFDQIMNNPVDVETKIMKSLCGAPANILFLAFVGVFALILSKKRARLAEAEAAAQNSENKEA